MSRTVDERARDVRTWLAAARAVHADRARLAARIASSTGLSPEGIEVGFECLERDATEAEVRALVASAGDAACVHVILSANVFVAPLRAIAIARAASARVTVRPSPRDPTLAAALVAAARDPAVSIAMARGLPGQADRIDVYGRDETIATVRSLARPGVVVRGHGAGLGVAYVANTDAELARAAEALAADVVPFDQRGCLSPRIALVEGPASRAEAFARALDDRLSALGSRVPRGALAPDERREAVRWRETLAFAGLVWSGAHHVVALAAPGTALSVPPVGRHVLVVRVDSGAEGRELLAPIARFVVTVGSSASDSAAAIAPGHARLAVLGRMQHPPLDGPVDLRSF
jgi:Acyl-CoA reductase (LuxC)